MTWYSLFRQPMINKNGAHASKVRHHMCSMCLMYLHTVDGLMRRRCPVGGTVPFSVSCQGVMGNWSIRCMMDYISACWRVKILMLMWWKLSICAHCFYDSTSTRLPVWGRKDPGSSRRNRGSSGSRSRGREKHSSKQEATLREVSPVPRFRHVQLNYNSSVLPG